MIPNPQFDRLKKALEKESGIVINSFSHCKKLSEWLKKKEVFISYSTLSRLFQLTSQQYQTHISTLDQISKAIGFYSYDLFLKITVNEDFNNVLLKQAQMHLYLLEHQNNPVKSAQFFQEKIIENQIIYKSLAQPLAKQLLNGHKKNLPALKWLAKSPIGRKHFFQFFVNEDDLSGIYTHSLTNLYDVSTKSEQDLIFSKLFYLRKSILKNPSQYKIVNKELVEIETNQLHLQNLHLFSRYTEVKLLTHFSEHKKVDSEFLNQHTKIILNHLKSNTPKNEIIAALGRWNRALMLTGNHDINVLPHSWIQICISEFFYGFQDLEFQSPTYAFLSKLEGLNMAKKIVHFNQWDNAILTSSLFLQTSQYVKNHKNFYFNKLGINPLFLNNLIK